MSEKIEITAFIQAVPGKAEHLKQAIIELIEKTLEEPGCEIFKVFQAHDDQEQFVLWEIFTNQAALQEHMAKDYTKKYFSLDLTASTKGTRHVQLSKA
ncbi:putative quinol monooxygenase [Orbus wheelerorum]|uniref:putative quinol monooxygenase n=1 Tax=Orbus wheelerorum TaxID=3074111 RepID=UPI00370D445E